MGGLLSDMGEVHNSSIFEKGGGMCQQISITRKARTANQYLDSGIKHGHLVWLEPMQGCLVLTSVGKYGDDPINRTDLKRSAASSRAGTFNQP